MILTEDSKRKKLTMPEIMVRAMYLLKDKLTMPVDQALLLLIEELKMPNAEAIQFGNTVFVTHYAPESNTAVMYALNIDTAKNLMKNGDLYIRHLMRRGTNGFVTSNERESFSSLFKLIEKNHLGVVQTWKDGEKFTTAVMFNPKKRVRPNA